MAVVSSINCSESFWALSTTSIMLTLPVLPSPPSLLLHSKYGFFIPPSKSLQLPLLPAFLITLFKCQHIISNILPSSASLSPPSTSRHLQTHPNSFPPPILTPSLPYKPPSPLYFAFFLPLYSLCKPLYSLLHTY